MLTSIDVGSLRGDLADRMVLIDLERISMRDRRNEQELERAFSEVYAGLLGALFTLAAEVLTVRESVTMSEAPRMADFARILVAIDKILGTHAVATYLDQSKRLAEDLIDEDPVANYLIAVVDRDGSWMGSNMQLCSQVAKTQSAHGRVARPMTPHRMAAHLKRLAPSLRAAGYTVEYTTGRARTRTWTVTKEPGE